MATRRTSRSLTALLSPTRSTRTTPTVTPVRLTGGSGNPGDTGQPDPPSGPTPMLPPSTFQPVTLGEVSTGSALVDGLANAGPKAPKGRLTATIENQLSGDPQPMIGSFVPGGSPSLPSPGGGGYTGIGGVQIGPGGISIEGSVAGIPISGSLPFGGSNQGSEAPAGTQGGCPGVFSVRDPITGNCVDLTALPPGGDPAMTGPVQTQTGSDGYGAAVKGIFGVGLVPRVEVQTVRKCPPGMQLGKDGVCYEGLARNSPKRAWPMGMKPLLTSGDRAAIRKANRAAMALQRSKKMLKKTARALDKAGC